MPEISPTKAGAMVGRYRSTLRTHVSIAFCVIGAASAIVAPLSAQTMGAPTAPTGRTVPHASGDSAQKVLNLVITSSRDAIASARIAVARVSSPEVQAYANRVIASHDSAIKAWSEKAPSLTLTLPDSVATLPVTAAMRTGGVKDGVSEVRDTTTARRGGLGGAAIHNASVSARAELEKLSGAAADAKYITTEREFADAVIKELEQFPTVHKDLQSLLTAYRNMLEDQRTKARRLPARNRQSP